MKHEPNYNSRALDTYLNVTANLNATAKLTAVSQINTSPFWAGLNLAES